MKEEMSFVAQGEVTVDCYCGDECDQLENRWKTYFEGDKEGEVFKEPLSLDPARFMPGTKIIITEPCCPECKKPASICCCGFDWEEWVLMRYS